MNAAKNLLAEKIAAPLEVVETSSAFITASANLAATTVELEAVSAAVDAANQLIQAVKDDNEATDKATVEDRISSLEAVRKRHAEPVLRLATDYATLVAAKKTLVDQKDAKKAPDSYDEQIRSLRGRYKQDFGDLWCGFQARPVRQELRGKGASVDVLPTFRYQRC